MKLQLMFLQCILPLILICCLCCCCYFCMQKYKNSVPGLSFIVDFISSIIGKLIPI